MIYLKLPWPPSINRYYRAAYNRVLIAEEGRKYRQTVSSIVMVERARANAARNPLPLPLTAPLAVHIQAMPPDRRARDLDNILKASLDALTCAGIWRDDSQINDLHVQRAAVTEGGAIRLTITPL